MATSSSRPRAVAVYCASSMGKHKAYASAAISVGHALAKANRPLVYGGGSKGIMGVVSGAVLEAGGKVTGVVPFAMVVAGGEGSKTPSTVDVVLNEKGREKVETIIVNSMHERKVEMAKRVGGFLGLPGGFGTFEEILEVTTWTQLGIHTKPVILLNVLSYFDPVRQLIQAGIREGFIPTSSEDLIIFIDGPGSSASPEEHESFDWGNAALKALDNWKSTIPEPMFDWTKRQNGEIRTTGDGALEAS